MMTDADFIREVQSCERTLYRVSRTILSSDADCCDAVQEALTYSEIAAVTHTPESTVKYRAVQARRALRREIEKQENELKGGAVK